MTNLANNTPAASSESSANQPPRRRLLATAEGSLADAFGPAEWGLLATIACIWGSSFLFIAIALESFRPALITLLRVALGAAALAVVPRARRPVAREDWPAIVLLGITWTAVPLVLFPIAQQWIASSLAGMINGAVPLFAALVSTLLLRRLPGPRLAVGLLVGFVGVVAVGWPAVASGADATALGVVLVLFATFCYGFSTNIAVPLQQRWGALPVLLRSQLVGLVLIAPFGVASVPASGFSWPSALAVLALGVLGTGWAYVAMGTLVGRVGAARGSVAVYFIPVVAVVLGVVFRDETVAPVSILGMVLVIVGAWLSSRRERRRAANADGPEAP